MSTLESLIHAHPRNQGTPLNLDRVEGLIVNRSAVERRAATLGGRRTVKKDWQAAWLLQAIRCIDLTALSGDDTPGNVHRLCAKAKQPVRQDLLDSLGVNRITTGAVCVYHQYVEDCVKNLEGTGIPVAAVSTGFPAGLSPMRERINEIKASVAAGADEIDIVITRGNVLRGDWSSEHRRNVDCRRPAPSPRHPQFPADDRRSGGQRRGAVRGCADRWDRRDDHRIGRRRPWVRHARTGCRHARERGSALRLLARARGR